MDANPQKPLSPACQMGIDALEHMTDAQRIALAIQAANKVESTHCISGLHRLSTLARDAAFELEAKRSVGEVHHA